MRDRAVLPRRAAAGVAAILLACTVAAPAEAKSCRGTHWVGAWAASPSNRGKQSFFGQTLRMNLTPLLGGQTLRLRLSNRFGRRAVTFDSVYIGKQQGGAALVPGSNRQVLFRGKRKVKIPPGRDAESDRVQLAFSAFEHLAVSLFTRGNTGGATEHFQAAQTSYFTPRGAGDHAGEEGGGAFTASTIERFFVTGIDVRAPRSKSAVVTFGDSITDGYQAPPDLSRGIFYQSGIDADERYPDFLARRLTATPDPSLSVLNAGIGGNQVLRDTPNYFGPRALSRFRADVGRQSGATDVIVLEGINDLGSLQSASAKRLIGGLRKLVGGLERLRGDSPRRKRLNVLVGTLLPAAGAGLLRYGTPLTNAKREQINRFIRASGIGSGVVDFDAALRDPANPSRLNPVYDSGDHLHPNSAGYKAMAETVAVDRLRGSGC